MWDKFVVELSQATQEFIRGVAQFLPRLLVTLFIVVIGGLAAWVIEVIVRSILRLVKFDRFSDDSGATQFLRRTALPSSTELLSRFVFWVAWKLFGYLPRLVAAVCLIFFGLLAASFFSRAALLAAVNAGSPSPKLISSAVRILITVLSISMAFEELGLAEQTVLIAFGLIFGALLFGLALAFGLGGQELAKRFLEARFMHHPQREHEDELSPL
jgi:small-conductance mechanosensitive channel